MILEEFTIDAEETSYAKDIAKNIVKWMGLKDYQAELVLNHLIILSDDDFSDFAQHNTEIITRVRIDHETGTVEKGGLFTEELLPAETVLYSLIMTTNFLLSKEERRDSDTFHVMKEAARDDEGKYLLDTIKDKLPSYIQLGGDATIGKGICRVCIVEKEGFV